MTSTALHSLVLAIGAVCAIGTAIEDHKTPAPWSEPAPATAAPSTDPVITAPPADDDSADFVARHPQFLV